MQRINRLFALNFQGFSFNEEIPSRLLLTGPNGSGKTTRLRVLSLALLGTDKKNGLAPFTSADEASVGVETTLGIKILRGSKMERNPLRVSSVSRIEPTQGEKTAATVDARIERDIRPNVIALELDRVFSLSGRERRRALLDAISAGSETSIAAVLKGLDEDLKDNPAWPRIRQSALGFAASGSPLEYLRALEGAAKAQASEYRAKKAAAEGLLRTAAPTAPTTSVEAAKKALAKADAELLEISNAAAAGKRGAQDRARLQREHASALAGVPEDLRSVSPSEREAAIEKQSKEATAKHVAAVEVSTGLQEDLVPAKAKAEAAKTAAQRWAGKVEALAAMLDVCEDDGNCPVCGTKDFPAATLKKKVEEARHSLKSLEGRWQKMQTDVRTLEIALKAAADTVAKAAEVCRGLVLAAASAKRLVEIDAALTANEAQSSAAFDEGATTSAQQRVREAQDTLSAASKAEGERKMRARAETDAEEADTNRAAAEEVQALVGPSGRQGDLLDKPITALIEATNKAWARPGALFFRMEDERGEPDAELVLQRAGATIPLSQLSRGERATALAALIAGLADARKDRMTVALIEAGEVDPRSLREMLAALAKHDGLANIVVESPWPIHGEADAIEEETGFVVRDLEVPAFA